MGRILIIEDEPDLAHVVEYNLRQAHHEVTWCSSGLEGQTVACTKNIDLVLLDLMLPDIPGTDVCKAIKQKKPSLPVMMLTAKGEEIDRIVGFELGADDYVVKPFSVRELMLRVQAILRRKESPSEPENIVSFGTLKIDRNAHRVWVAEQEVELTALEFNLLVTLWERKNRVQSRATLLDVVWGISADISTRTVDTHVKRLREKLGAKAANYVETVRGVGYRFSENP